MGVLRIDEAVWHLTAWGEAMATYGVSLQDGVRQPVVVRVEASTLANADLPAEGGFDAVVPAVDRAARDEIAHLASTGRISPEIVITPERFARLLNDA
jgi:hypothetical protein